jgi:plastocyanin
MYPVLLVALFAILLGACGSTPPKPVAFTIEMDEFDFTPEELEVRVGQEVTITLVNVGALDHEFMIGRDVNYNADLQPTGYVDDFFAVGGVLPEVSGGMLMDHNEDEMGGMDHGDDDMDDSEDMTEPMDVNMVMQPVGSDQTVISFTVTEAMLGDWEIGCFELDGVHYTSGMVGTLAVKN